jgi:hypothetical protein
LLFSQKFISIIKGLMVTEAMALGNFKLHKLHVLEFLSCFFLLTQKKQKKERQNWLKLFTIYLMGKCYLANGKCWQDDWMLPLGVVALNGRRGARWPDVAGGHSSVKWTQWVPPALPSCFQTPRCRSQSRQARGREIPAHGSIWSRWWLRTVWHLKLFEFEICGLFPHLYDKGQKGSGFWEPGLNVPYLTFVGFEPWFKTSFSK